MTTRSNALVRPPTASSVKATGKYRKGNNPVYVSIGSYRLPQGGFERLEPDEGKLSRPVLGGEWASDGLFLPDKELVQPSQGGNAR
jgi:hypothetical protein